jgi:starch synthase (maltosyl-transferring)
MSPSYGLYSGYELCENQPARETDEEYFNSEKYEIKHRDFDAPGNLRPYIAKINAMRRAHPCLQELKNITFHYAENPQLLVYSKANPTRSDVILVVANLDATYAQSGTLGLDLGKIGIDPYRPFVADDLLTGTRYEWNGPNPWVRLDPNREPAHILHLIQSPP